MVEFESPLGKTSFGAQSGSGMPQRRVMTISDESEQKHVQQSQGYMRRQPPMEVPQQQPGIRELTLEERDELERKRLETRTLMEKVSPQAKQRIEFLCNLGRLTDEFKIDDTKFEIRSLKSKELKEILLAVANVNPLILGIDLRNQTLARSVYKIDNQTMDLVLGTTDFEARVALWDEMDDHVSEFVNDKYQRLAKKAQKKYGINNEEDVKQVMSDIKKS